MLSPPDDVTPEEMDEIQVLEELVDEWMGDIGDQTHFGRYLKWLKAHYPELA